MRLKKSQKRLQISGSQLKALQGRIRDRALADEDWDVVMAMTETVECLAQALAEKETAIARLCKYLLGAPTETARNVLKGQKNHGASSTDPRSGKTPPKGHGRKPASAYEGGAKVHIDHPSLHPGDRCPGCEKGKVYELALPSVFVRIVGQAPLQATVYERTRLRCNLCGEVFTPELPPEAGEAKHDESAAAMVAVLKYGCGMPFHRLERLQANLGQPVPASTQWDILQKAAVDIAPLHDALESCAAQGELMHNDDTTAKILSLLGEQEPENPRTGIFTTGIVSLWQDHRIALFKTGGRHAGANLQNLLAARATGLPPPIQMCDALSRNVPRQYATILANCLAHARRQFVELIERFPDECTHVIEELAKVYKHDALIKEQGLSPAQRLASHQEHSGPVMEGLKEWCETQLGENLVEPNSGLGKAVKYMLKHWKKLARFLEIPGTPLDNNIAERALKYAILHRKNALFFKTQNGANVGDLFMSLIHTAQLAGVNPLKYLTWVFKNVKILQSTPSDFLPWRYREDTG
ncbi:MAG: IS66 family transposase [candidate division NC10 bacterium]|nr:IS66 family transposase [candidate division NC10 bacterium]